MQHLREHGWDELLKDVDKFCVDNKIDIISMEDIIPGRFNAMNGCKTYHHRFRVEIFCEVIH